MSTNIGFPNVLFATSLTASAATSKGSRYPTRSASQTPNTGEINAITAKNINKRFMPLRTEEPSARDMQQLRR